DEVGYPAPDPRILTQEATRTLLLRALGAREGDPPPERVLCALATAVQLVRLGEGADAAGETTVALARTYERLLREQHAVDYPAMLALPLRLFQGRPEILRRYRDAYRHLLVDEFQDLNRAQYRLA